ncbi:MAG: hypothetical protein ABI861_06760 [Panacibacter sp.]
MKLTAKILLVMLMLFTTGLFASNMILKSEYDKLDKSNTYWTYGKILEQPFKYLKIEGGNITNIVFEPGKKSSVNVFKDWNGYRESKVKASVKNDTLHLNFPNTYKDVYEKDWLKWNTMVHIISPELLSVEGFDTKLEMFKMKQKNINVSMSGKSAFELESYIAHFDTLHITQSDSSEVVFEMSPDVKGPGTYTVHSVNANLQGVSSLDLGRAEIDSLKFNIVDSSAIFFSGSTLKKIQQHKF